MARTANDAYTLIAPSSFLPFTDIVEGGGGVKDAVKALATNQNHIHRQCQKVYACQDSQEQAESEYISRTTSAVVGTPDIIHVWWADHLLADADLALDLHYKTTDGGSGGRMGLKFQVVEPDGNVIDLGTVVLDNATWTTYTFTASNIWSTVDDPTYHHLIVLGCYEVDSGASLELKHVTVYSVADATATVASGIRTSGFVPNDDTAYDANSPLDVAHAQQLVDNVHALAADKTSTFLNWSEYLLEPSGLFLKSSSLSTEWSRIIGPIPVAVLPGRTLKYALLGYGEHAACKYRVFTGHMALSNKGSGSSFSSTSVTVDPTDPDLWDVGTLTPAPAETGKMLVDRVYVEWVTPDDGGGGGRNTAILGFCVYEV